MEFFDFFEKCNFFTVFGFLNCLWCVPLSEKRENNFKKFENQPILAIFYQFKSDFEKSWLRG
jgi:hypothetical protein